LIFQPKWQFMEWITLKTEDQFENILEKSFETPQLIYKHSNACGISSMVKQRLEKNTPPAGVEFYFLDILRFRSISNKIAAELDVQHESPQVLLIKNARCIYDESHLGITMKGIRSHNVAA
jgi:bacillithiol system protein YtxJ